MNHDILVSALLINAVANPVPATAILAPNEGATPAGKAAASLTERTAP